MSSQLAKDLSGLVFAVLLMAWVLSSLPSRPADASHLDLAGAWLVAFMSFFAFATAGEKRPARELAASPARHWHAILLVVLTLLAVLLRVWGLDRVPFVLSGDEASHGLHALRVLTGEIRNPFATAWLSVPNGTFFFNSVSLAMFGPTVTALRLPWALVGTATIPITYFLVARLTNRTLAFATAALVALYHFHIHYSRLGANQIADPLFASLALLCLFRALDEDRRSDWVWLGAVSGLALYFYAGARLTPIVVMAVLSYAFLLQGRQFWHRHAAGMLVATGAFVIVAAPMFQYAWRFPDEFNGRLNEVGIIQSGWLAREVESRQSSVIEVLADQLWRSALAFNHYPDRTVWYGLPQPLLDPIFGVVFVLGLGLAMVEAVRRPGNVRLFAMVIWWWAGVTLGGMLTVDPPSTMRLVTLTVPVCFLIAFALSQLFTRVGHPSRKVALLGAAIVAFGVISLKTYFIDFVPQRRSGGPHAEMATEVSALLRARPAVRRVYFAGAPWMFAGFPTWHYLVPSVSFEDVLDPLRSTADLKALWPGEPALFVFLPERAGELSVLQEAEPQGTLEEVHSGADGRLLAVVYEVPAR